MLSKILSKDDCKKCRLCCYLEKKEYDELMSFTKLEMEYAKKQKEVHFKNIGNFYFIDIEKENAKINTNNYFECPYHSDDVGCTLSAKKPLACKLWPFAVMSDDGVDGIHLSKECKIINEKGLTIIKKFVNDDLYKFIIDKIKCNEIHILEKNDDYMLIREI